MIHEKPISFWKTYFVRISTCCVSTIVFCLGSQKNISKKSPRTTSSLYVKYISYLFSCRMGELDYYYLCFVFSYLQETLESICHSRIWRIGVIGRIGVVEVRDFFGKRAFQYRTHRDDETMMAKVHFLPSDRTRCCDGWSMITSAWRWVFGI